MRIGMVVFLLCLASGVAMADEVAPGVRLVPKHLVAEQELWLSTMSDIKLEGIRAGYLNLKREMAGGWPHGAPEMTADYVITVIYLDDGREWYIGPGDTLEVDFGSGPIRTLKVLSVRTPAEVEVLSSWSGIKWAANARGWMKVGSGGYYTVLVFPLDSVPPEDEWINEPTVRLVERG